MGKKDQESTLSIISIVLIYVGIFMFLYYLVIHKCAGLFLRVWTALLVIAIEYIGSYALYDYAENAPKYEYPHMQGILWFLFALYGITLLLSYWKLYRWTRVPARR
jgi:hypothetical protein